MHYLLFNVQFSETCLLLANQIENKCGRGIVYKVLCKIIYILFPKTTNCNVEFIEESNGLADLKQDNKHSLLPYRDTDYKNNDRLVVFDQYYSKEIIIEDILYFRGSLHNGYSIILHVTKSEKSYIAAICLVSLILNLYSVDTIVGIIREVIPNFKISTTSLVKAQNIVDKTRNIGNKHCDLYKVKFGNKNQNGDYRKSQARNSSKNFA